MPSATKLKVKTEEKSVSPTHDISHLSFFAPAPEVKSLNKKKILVVDDKVTNRTILLRMLSNHLCVQAADGEKAVDEIKKALAEGAPFDCVIMDIEMPVMDGHAATQEIRKLDSLVPILCFSTTIDSQEKLERLTSGMSGFLNKAPVNQTQLKLAIKKCSRLPVSPSIVERKALLIDSSPDSSLSFAGNPFSFFSTFPATPRFGSTFPLSSMGLAVNPDRAYSGSSSWKPSILATPISV